MNRPEMMLGDAHQAFDEAGRLTEPKAREHLAAFLAALADFVRERDRA
jgi:hypothetical protein